MHTRPGTWGFESFSKTSRPSRKFANWFEGDNMARVLKCGDVNPGCNAEIRSDA